jgi:hypothetical protein
MQEAYKRRWNGLIKIDRREMGCEDVDCIKLAQDRYQWRALVIWVMNLPSSVKGDVFLDCVRDCYLLKKGFLLWN